ncbi:unnamed protein product [Parajaminaea phylloscopi]
MASQHDIEQVAAIAGCDEVQARRALTKYNGKVEEAINAIFDQETFPDDVSPGAQSTALTHHGGPNWGGLQPLVQGPAERPHPPSPVLTPQPAGAGTSSENPIDFTTTAVGGREDEDSDLERAIKASLEGQGGPGQTPASGSAIHTMDDDAAMDQAIMNSMNFDQGELALSAPAEAPTPAVREPPCPMVMTSRLPVMATVTAVLQALLASPTACEAFLSIRPVDARIAQGITGYASGVSPSNDSPTPTNISNDVPAPNWPFLQTAWRLQLLCAFSSLAVNACCDIGDVAAGIPADVLRKASRSEPLADIAAAYYTHAVRSLHEAVPWLERVSGASDSTGEGRDRLAWEEIQNTFRSVGTTQTPSTEAHDGVQRPTENYHAFELSLEPDDVSRTVTAALEASLAAQQAAIAESAKVLAFTVRPRAAPQASSAAIEESGIILEPTIYLDRFMWRRRCGLPPGMLSGALEAKEQIRQSQLRVQSLRERLDKLSQSDGIPIKDLIAQSVEYFKHGAQSRDDPLRQSQQQEAAERLEETLNVVLAETESVSAQLAQEEGGVATLRKDLHTRKDAAFDHEEWRTLSYSLRSVLMSDDGGSWAYVKSGPAAAGAAVPSATSATPAEDEQWWRIEGGKALPVSQQIVLEDRRGQQGGHGAYFLLYEQDPPSRLKGTSISAYIPHALEEQIEQENELLESTLLSLRAPEGSPTRDEAETAEQAVNGDVESQNMREASQPARSESSDLVAGPPINLDEDGDTKMT